jgi:hypothetical protein
VIALNTLVTSKVAAMIEVELDGGERADLAAAEGVAGQGDRREAAPGHVVAAQPQVDAEAQDVIVALLEQGDGVVDRAGAQGHLAEADEAAPLRELEGEGLAVDVRRHRHALFGVEAGELDVHAVHRGLAAGQQVADVGRLGGRQHELAQVGGAEHGLPRPPVMLAGRMWPSGGGAELGSSA